ncbi:MAG: DUF86 domain-containing protein [Actinomycetota bacterium]|jgi:uncharacterized protein with HEPN domain|nr:DUF86 domain-containing protein [Actinomycetota bacterium]
MRPRDVHIPLYDMLQAADAVASFIEGHSGEQYAQDLMFRSAVERQFEIVEEAMNRALGIEPELATRLTESRGVVDFRNVIAHDYDRLADATVWDVAVNHLPLLRARIAKELASANSHRARELAEGTD